MIRMSSSPGRLAGASVIRIVKPITSAPDPDELSRKPTAGAAIAAVGPSETDRSNDIDGHEGI